MKKDVDSIFDSVNISKIGKYDKFINFVRLPPNYQEKSLFPDDVPFYFTTDYLAMEKLSKDDMFLAMEKVRLRLEKAIEQELLNNCELKKKICEIKEKAEIKINKAKVKIIKKYKLREKFNLKHVDDYFDKINLNSKLNSSEEPSSSSESPESSP